MNIDEIVPVISKVAGGVAAGMNPDANSVGAQTGANAMDMADAMIMREMAEKERKKQEEAKKKGMLGSVGSMLGTIAGTALAPFTGGSSLVLAGLGSGLGNAAGQVLAGGGVDWANAAKSGITTGITAGIAPGAFNAVGMDKLATLPGSLGIKAGEWGLEHGLGTMANQALSGAAQGAGILTQGAMLKGGMNALTGGMGGNRKYDEYGRPIDSYALDFIGGW